MAQLSDQSSSKREMSKGTWTIDEDQRLAQVVEVHGPGRWKSIVAKSGLNRCAKSCRLRWVNYLRPNIRRGSISADEEDLIIRLHKLLGNRWSLIAGRLPGRTDNDVKNYWNSHLKKKIMKQKEPQNTTASKDVLQEEYVRPRTGSVVEMTATVLKEGEADISRRSDDREVTKASEEEEDKNGVFDCCGSIDDEAAWNSSEWTSQFLLKMDEGWSESSPDQ